MKKILFASLLLIAGCGTPGPQIWKAYGVSGKQYTAPDMCAALTACLAAGEKQCYYEVANSINVNGSTEIDACKVAEKKDNK